MNKNKNIFVRVSKEDKKFLAQAARIKKQTLSAFIREAAETEARTTLAWNKKETKR